MLRTNNRIVLLWAGLSVISAGCISFNVDATEDQTEKRLSGLESRVQKLEQQAFPLQMQNGSEGRSQGE